MDTATKETVPTIPTNQIESFARHLTGKVRGTKEKVEAKPQDPQALFSQFDSALKQAASGWFRAEQKLKQYGQAAVVAAWEVGRILQAARATATESNLPLGEVAKWADGYRINTRRISEANRIFEGYPEQKALEGHNIKSALKALKPEDQQEKPKGKPRGIHANRPATPPVTSQKPQEKAAAPVVTTSHLSATKPAKAPIPQVSPAPVSLTPEVLIAFTDAEMAQEANDLEALLESLEGVTANLAEFHTLEDDQKKRIGRAVKTLQGLL